MFYSVSTSHNQKRDTTRTEEPRVGDESRKKKKRKERNMWGGRLG